MTAFERKQAETGAPAGVPGTALLSKALDIVEFVAGANNRVKLRDISAATGYAKPTLYRILSALVQRGMLQQDPRDSAYALGPRFTELAGAVAQNTELITLAALPLKTLALKYGERVNLGVLDGSAQRSVACWPGFDEPYQADIGTLKPLYCTALGKALLAFQTSSVRDDLVGAMQFEPLTHATHRSKASLAADLAATRNRGFARDDEEIIEGTRCVAAPVLDPRGTPVAAISVSGPAFRLTDIKVDEIAADLRAAAAAIASRLSERTDSAARASRARDLPVGMSAEALSTFGVAALVPFDEAYLAVDGLGARVLCVNSARAETVLRCARPIDGLAMHGTVAFVLTGEAIGRIDVVSPSSPMASHARLGQPADDIGIEDGEVIVGIGDEVARLGNDGRLTRLAGDRRPGTRFARMGGRLAYITDDGLRPVSKRGLIVPLPRATHAVAEGPSDTFFEIGAEDWSVGVLGVRGDQRMRLPVPVPRPSALATDLQRNVLLIGSARTTLSTAQLDLSPLSGGVLRVDLSTIGQSKGTS